MQIYDMDIRSNLRAMAQYVAYDTQEDQYRNCKSDHNENHPHQLVVVS